jgi:hypothetical protein
LSARTSSRLVASVFSQPSRPVSVEASQHGDRVWRNGSFVAVGRGLPGANLSDAGLVVVSDDHPDDRSHRDDKDERGDGAARGWGHGEETLVGP